MRLSPLALAAVAALAPYAASAQDSSGATGAAGAAVASQQTLTEPTVPRGSGLGSRSWGVAMGAGFPDFATASVVFRPIPKLRLSAGPAWNYVGWGLQGGVAYLPWRFWIAPLVSVEGGHFFRNNLGFMANDSRGVPQELKPLLEKIDYSYAALDVGVEIGSQRGFSASIRLGLSYVALGSNGTVTYTTSGGDTVSLRDPSIHGTLPSVKIGFQYWL